MARWRLIAKHYLPVDDCMWEYKETDRQTGRLIRKQFPVPRYLNPDDPADWTLVTARNQSGGSAIGEIIVCDDGTSQPGDLRFYGEPTPDMFPLDPEAEAITEQLRPKWKHPIDSIPGTYSQSLLDDLQRQGAQVQTEGTKAAQIPG